MTPRLKFFMIMTDVGMLAYWVITALASAAVIEIPPDWLFSAYHEPTIVAWNWSFMPLDMLFSILGIVSIRLETYNNLHWKYICLLSLSMTVSAGLMAMSFWSIRNEFSPVWWAMNLYLMLWPIPFIFKIIYKDFDYNASKSISVST